MNAYEFGRYAYENGGLDRVVAATQYAARNTGLSEAVRIAGGAASYYNPYIAAVATVPVVYNTAKWLVDKLT